MLHVKEFSKYAQNYEKNRQIQKEAAKKLISMLDFHPKTILDLGSGSGAMCKEFDFKFEKFIAVDSAENMCKLHPKAENIEVINKNFEDISLAEDLERYKHIDLIVSSSALQWAKSLENVMQFCKNTSENILFSIFTCNTFKTIYELTSLQSFLLSSEEIVKIVRKYYDIEFEVKEYKLYFEDNISKFRYIKKSGISGGKKRLSVAQTKNLIQNYPLNYLEFEVIYIKSK